MTLPTRLVSLFFRDFYFNLTVNPLFPMGSSLMRAVSSALPSEPTEATDTPSQQDPFPPMDIDPTPPMDVPPSTNEDVDPPRPPIVPETGRSPNQDEDLSFAAVPPLDPPPGNWEIGHNDVYTQRQQVPGSPLFQSSMYGSPSSVQNVTPSEVPGVSIPGAAPKARGPPLPVVEAEQPPVTITVPLPCRQRMNPHMPTPANQRSNPQDALCVSS